MSVETPMISQKQLKQLIRELKARQSGGNYLCPR